MEVINSGPCLNISLHEYLLAPISNEDIKNALFSIGNDKALGPNGYSSLVFKKSWDIVGRDFCSAVKNFFSSSQLLR